MIAPGKTLENALRIINHVMNYSSTPYWLCFGGLWGLVQNDGVVPDGDLDICTYYGMDHNRVAKAFAGSPGRYELHKTMISDTEKDKALYCSFGSAAGFPHVCLTFWYLHDGIRYYCHDQHHEVETCGIPKSGYFFRGIPSYVTDNEPENFRMAEWPGIVQSTKIRVPRLVGIALDHLYPDWAFIKQRYEVRSGVVNNDKTASVYKGGAVSPYAVHVGSMRDWNNETHVKNELAKSKRDWEIKRKNIK